MTIKKTTATKRALKEEKREAAATPVSKKAPKKEFNDDKNDQLEGYDENEYDTKDKIDEKRRRAQ